jgi:spermidine synthase
MNGRAAAITLAAFLAGAVLLCVEIAASRVLAPFFGNSLFVWGALIGVVLSGLAVGYWVGGTLADRFPRPQLLVAAIALGAAGVLAIPFLDQTVLEAVTGWDPGTRADPLVASVLLFGAPSVVLASVTPIAVRLRAHELSHLGRTAGRLFAVSTVGSIVGTFTTAFWLLPQLGTDQVLGIGAAVLFAAALAVSLSERLLAGTLVALCATVAAAAVVASLAPETGARLSKAAARNWSPVYRLRGNPSSLPDVDLSGAKVIYRKDTRYHQLAVVEGSTTRTLRFGSSFQSEMYLGDPFKTAYPYTDYFFLGAAYRPSAGNMLFLGLGGGSAPKRVWRDLPTLRLTVVELDPVVVDVARRFFRVPDDPRLVIAVSDARQYLERHSGRWDVIAVDTFYEDGVPFHLTTREFLELARERLSPGGVIVTNVIGSLRGDGSKLFRALYRTYRSVFPTVLVHPVGVGVGYQNLILVATDGPAPRKAFLDEQWQRVRAKHPSAPDLIDAIANRYDALIPTGDVPILTDAYAPVDALLVD